MNKTNKVTVQNIKNANELPSFVPVEGQWEVNGTSEERDYNEIVEAIESSLGAAFKVKVDLYHDNGHAITGDLPSGGTFLATRA